MESVRGRWDILAWVPVLLRIQPWVDWEMVRGGIQALADLGIPSLVLGFGAWVLLAVGTGHMTVG